MTTVVLPPGPLVPRLVETFHAFVRPQRRMRGLRERYGDAFTVRTALFGPTVVLCEPAEIKQLFHAPTDAADIPSRNLGRVLGPGSLFALLGEEHRRQRRLLVPPFHGRRLAAYESIIEDETLAEIATWPEGREFPTLPSMMRITVNVILRTVFGAAGPELAELRRLLPAIVTLGSRLAVLPVPDVDWGRFSPWGRFHAMRREYDSIVGRLIDAAERDGLDGRDDILAMMLQSRYEDGSAMSRSEIADELLTLLSAGHETTATTLAWTIERLRRHPDVLARLVAEVDAGGKALREATICEVQRTRPVIDRVARQVRADTLHIGRWTIPRGYVVVAAIELVHADDAVFDNAAAFDPTRFLDAKPDLYQWIPFGGGARRCLGAAFANTETHVVLRTLLREVTLAPTTERDERWHSRGIASAPARGGRAVVHRRRARRGAPALTARSTDAS